jgi:hypothetical protein
MPNKSEIIEKAFAIHHNRNHNVSSINPEVEELKESGIYEEAKRKLMRSEDSEYQSYIEREAARLGLVPNKVKLETYGFELNVKEAMKNGVCITGTSQSGKSNLAFQIADKLMREEITVYVIDPSQTWMRNSNVPFVVEVKPNVPLSWKGDKSVIFDTSRLHVPVQQAFIEQFCKIIMDAAIDTEQSERNQIFVIFEEAHTPLPNHALYSNKFAETVRLLTQGANFGVRFMTITQFPSMMDKLPIKMSQQRFFGLTSEPNDLKYLRSFLGDRVKELETLETGEFLYDHKKETKLIETKEFETEVKPSKMWQAEPKEKAEPQEQTKPPETDWLQLACAAFQIASLLVFLAVCAMVFLSW